MEGELEEEPRRPRHEKIDRDADHHLIGPEADRGDRVEKCQRSATSDRANEPDPRAAAVVARHRAAERAAEHVPLEPEADQSRSLGDDPAARREQVRNRDAQRLREKDEDDHAGAPAGRRKTRRTSGTDAATAMITTACS